METTRTRSKSLLLFYILVGYVICQFGWWFYMLFDLNRTLYALRHDIFVLQGLLPGEELNDKLQKKWIMIVGEGLVFISLLAIGIFQIRKTFKKEAALARLQNNFLLSVTHELKSPLASIKLYLQTLGKRSLDEDRKQQLITKAVDDTERLNQLVENILLVNRIEHHAHIIQKERLEIREVVSKVIKNHAAYQNRIIVNMPEQPVYMEADALALEFMLDNLINNAGKYAPDDTPIQINIINHKLGVSIEVHDQGPGIAENEKRKIFERFYRVGNEETRKTKGTGLGLYIVNELAKLHKGYVEVKDSIYQGTCFRLNLPA